MWRRLALGPLGSQNKREVLSDVDWTVRERRVRNVTHGRLHIIEHLEHGFRHSRPAAVMAAKSRAKSRTLWGSGRGELEKPLGSGRGGPGAADEAAARAIADKLKGKAARLTGNNLQSRLVTAGKSERWAERLVGALPGAGAGAQGAPQEAGAGEVLRAAWAAAANPSGRTASGIKGGRARVDEVAAELTTALPPRESSGMDIDEVGGEAREVGGGGGVGGEMARFESLGDNDASAQRAYEALLAEWLVAKGRALAVGAKPPQPPFNVEQRALARGVLDAARFRAEHQPREDGASVQEWARYGRAMAGRGLEQIHLLYGPGGVGKSATIEAIDSATEQLGLSATVVTAYTGVAAAPFAGATAARCPRGLGT